MWRCARVVPEFRPHLHQPSCVICKAAEASALLAVQYPPLPESTATTSIISPQRSFLPAATPAPATAATASLSTVERRRDGFQQWLQIFSSGGSTPDPDASPSCVRSGDEFNACYRTYLQCDDAETQEGLFRTLLDALDRQCTRSGSLSDTNNKSAAPTSAFSEGNASSVRVPTRLVLPPTFEGVSTASTPDNVFEQHVREVLGTASNTVAKQLAFQDALLSIRDVLDAQKIPFFLACGTALGAWRNGCFIPFDEDIDLGILFSDLCGSDAATVLDSSAPELRSFVSSPAVHRAQDRLYHLAHALASTGHFLIFDVCGAVEKGFELRVMHTPTNTRIDVNLYYPPVAGDDDALVEADGPFLWASSFYEAADRRAHNMYRYRHRPFDAELTRRTFCERTRDGPGFRVPPVRYLEENYGADWKTPRQYTYSEGLAREFKNIIDE